MKFTVFVPRTITEIIRGVEAEDADSAVDNIEETSSICSSCAQTFYFGDDANWENAWAEPETSEAPKEDHR